MGPCIDQTEGPVTVIYAVVKGRSANDPAIFAAQE